MTLAPPPANVLDLPWHFAHGMMNGDETGWHVFSHGGHLVAKVALIQQAAAIVAAVNATATHTSSPDPLAETPENVEVVARALFEADVGGNGPPYDTWEACIHRGHSAEARRDHARRFLAALRARRTP